jgi:hypothetical protein
MLDPIGEKFPLKFRLHCSLIRSVQFYPRNPGLNLDLGSTNSSRIAPLSRKSELTERPRMRPEVPHTYMSSIGLMFWSLHCIHKHTFTETLKLVLLCKAPNMNAAHKLGVCFLFALYLWLG